MKILQISSASSFGGGERYLADLSSTLISRGHEVAVAVRPASPILDHLKLPEGNIKLLPLRNALDVASAHQLAQYVKDRKFDVVHAHMARDYSLAAYATRRNPKTAFFVTRHVLFPLNALHRETLRKAAGVIAVSEAVGRVLRSQNLLNPGRIRVVPNGIDLSRFGSVLPEFNRDEFLAKYNLPIDCLLIGSVGELRTLKRHDDFLRAAALVSKEFSRAHFVIAGVDTARGAETRTKLMRLVSELGLDERVHFFGWVDEAERLLHAFDVFVSASETESFGLSIAEAMAAETAVVSTATEGASEVVRHDESGLLVPVGDWEKLAEAIASLLRDPAKRERFGKRGGQIVNERFSLERMVDQIEELYLTATR